jgi:hypothetical protein
MLGLAVGTAELVSRYKDSPFRAVATAPAILYLGINVLASVSAFAAIRQFHWLNTADSDPTNTIVLQALVAGVSAMAFFRSSLFTVRVGNLDIGVGPAAFLQIILNAADRACDRERAQPRANSMNFFVCGFSGLGLPKRSKYHSAL